MDCVSGIIDYENGDLDYDETFALFQRLIDTGVINSLQGAYQRTAHALIQSGDCHAR